MMKHVHHVLSFLGCIYFIAMTCIYSKYVSFLKLCYVSVHDFF